MNAGGLTDTLIGAMIGAGVTVITDYLIDVAWRMEMAVLLLVVGGGWALVRGLRRQAMP